MDVRELSPTQLQGLTAAMPTVRAPASVSKAPRTGPPDMPPGEVEIAQYGDFEENLAYWGRGGYLAVRFDPPFAPPYIIKEIRFMSATTNGAPAVFPSILVCGPAAPFGRPDLDAPLYRFESYVGSSDGENVLQLHHTVSDSGRTFYVCVEVPAFAGTIPPSDYPFLRMDQQDLEKGNFWNSCVVQRLGIGTFANFFPDRNLIMSMVCELPNAERVPIASATNLGANRVASGIEFSFVQPPDVRADGTAMSTNSLLRTRLLWRAGTGPWTVADSAGAGRSSFELPSLPAGLGQSLYWSTQAVDKNRNGSILSSGPLTVGGTILGDPFGVYDYDEPNGELHEATQLTPPYGWRDDVYAPAGDQDYYALSARPGDLVSVGGTYWKDGTGDMSPVILLFDASGKAVAGSEPNRFGLSYIVPQSSAHAREVAPRPYTLLITDRSTLPGSRHAPRPGQPFETVYSWVLYVGPATPDAASEAASLTKEAASRGRLVTALPSGKTRVEFRIQEDDRISSLIVHVFDVRGRLVRTLVPERSGGSDISTVWDGYDDYGVRVGKGCYFVRLVAGNRACVARVVKAN